MVHGRFYAFDLVRELILQGHQAVLFTNYPKFIAKKYRIPSQNVHSFLFHGVLTRIIAFLHRRFGFCDFEAVLHMMFSRWAAKKLIKENWDIVKVFSGVGEEVLKSLGTHCKVKMLLRGSSHIHTQARLLEEEEKRAGVKIDRPSPWMIAREEREYRLADNTLVLSGFAKRSFLEEGYDPKKLRILLLGSDLKRFRPVEEIIRQRQKRILSGEPLRVLTVGTFSMQKGALDLIKIAQPGSKSFIFRFLGFVSDETKNIKDNIKKHMEFIPRQPEFDLPSFYAWADLFLYPTIQDGYAAVLAQAQAAGLPALTTPNSSGPDIVCDGQSGWILPIRSPATFLKQLDWCDQHRHELASMVGSIYEKFQLRDWSHVAHDFIRICHDLLSQKEQ